MEEACIALLPDQWVAADQFEYALQAAWKRFTSPQCSRVIFHFPPSCKIMVDAAVRLLSLANQLIAKGTAVTFTFDGENHDAMQYLHRANFFTVLAKQVQVTPRRPDPRTVARYQGNNPRLIEFQMLRSGHESATEHLPSQLTNALKRATVNRKDTRIQDTRQLESATFTIFAELISNVEQHSQTVLDGFAALQVYSQGGKVQVVVSDSGVGLLETLRPKLLSLEVRHLEDAELIRSLFHGDLQWNPAGKGQGLRGCAFHALKFRGTVDIRLATCSIHLGPSSNGYGDARCRQGLVPLQGTHICFTFSLDNPS